MTPDDAVRALEEMNLQQLREEWRRRFGAPPKLRSPSLVRQCLAWRMQIDAHGGMGLSLKRKLKGSADMTHGLPTGSRLTREWNGTRHEVEVVDGAFLYAGQRWKSLSAIATEIAGARWNGPRFFGLRQA